MVDESGNHQARGASGYAIAVASGAAAAALGQWLGAMLGGPTPLPLLLLAAVAVSAGLGGAGPGLLAGALGSLALLILRSPAPAAWLQSAAAMAEPAVFLAVAILASWLGELAHRRRRALETRCRVAEREVRERRRAGEAIVMSNRRKDEFLATLSHELRNALAPTRNALEILRRPEVDASTVGYAKALIERQMVQLVRLVDDLLDVSRIGRGGIELRRQEIDAGTVLRHAVDALGPLIQAAGHQVSLSLPPGPVMLHADPARLAQVFSNVLLNACKFTPSGGRIRVRMVDDGTGITVSVRDNGIGIAPDMLDRVFEMFERGSAPRDRPSSGLGIGLALARRLVEMHAGSIEARSEGIGKGAEFLVRLPGIGGDAGLSGGRSRFGAPAA